MLTDFKIFAKIQKILQNSLMQVNFDKNSLIVDGKRVLIRSGAFHYFRTPGSELALDRFRKMKAAGYNAVDIYFNWNYHSKAEGEYDFSGIKDVRKILQAAKDTGLYIIARPGPFINAEINAGGLPFWLLNKENVIPRNRIGSAYNYSPEYMKYITQWYEQIIPIIKDFENVIAFQIENEYATDEMDEGYMRELYDMARKGGITCPIFHNDAYNAGLWADLVDIYACDIYPYINPNQNWKQDNFCFDTLDNLEEMVRCFKMDAPIFIAEMQGGWFDKWDGIGYKAMREALGDEHINIVTKTAISQGVTMFNHYMAVGGTSWDDLACDEVYTSYEFCAGIDEYGSIQPNFLKAKEINYFLNSFGLENTELSDTADDILDGDYVDIYARRRKDNDNNCQWLFLRNLNPEGTDIKLQNGYSVKLNPYDMKIITEKLQLNACKIDFSDAEIFTRIKNENNEILLILTDSNAKIHLDISGEKQCISVDKKDYENLKYEHNGKTTQFLFISKELATKTWVLDNKVIFNADFVYPNGRIALSKDTEIAYFDLVNGFSKKYCKLNEQLKLKKINDFDTAFCAPEIDVNYDYSCWKKVEGSLDCLSIGLYNEFIWYKAQIPDYLEEITLSARHLFAVYINGKEVLNRNSYKYEKLQQIEETISIQLNKEILNKDKNELTILVQNLGFDKGFSGETNSPRGLVEFSVKPECKIDFYVQEKLAVERADDFEFNESDSPYLIKLSKTFDVEFKDDIVRSMFLSLENFPYERATIFLNGVKIGRYLKNNKNKALQDKFYLIDTFLKSKNQLDIIVWEKASNIKTAWDFKFEATHVIITVGDERIHQIY